MLAAAVDEGGNSVERVSALAGVGLLLWWVFEHSVHRYFMHHRGADGKFTRPGAAVHHAHHEDPRSMEGLVVSLVFSVPVAVCTLLLGQLIAGEWQGTVFFYTGFLSGYVCYEVLHYRAHHSSPRLKVFKYLKRYHLLHHYESPGRRYMITFPPFDYVFGTFRSAGRRAARRARVKPAGVAASGNA